MALFYMAEEPVTRSKGQSAMARAAYIAGERLTSTYYGETTNCLDKKDVVCSGILLPPQAPSALADRQTLWDTVEAADPGTKSCVARTLVIALQNELTMAENIEMARRFLQENLVSRGIICDYAVHLPVPKDGHPPNPHLHVLCPARALDGEGQWLPRKVRTVEADADGKQTVRYVAPTDWGTRKRQGELRQIWTDLCNAKFEEKGLDVRIDCRSLREQGVDRLPGVHEPPAIHAMEEKGIRTHRGNLNRWIHATNEEIEQTLETLAGLQAQRRDLETRLAALERTAARETGQPDRKAPSRDSAR